MSRFFTEQMKDGLLRFSDVQVLKTLSLPFLCSRELNEEMKDRNITKYLYSLRKYFGPCQYSFLVSIANNADFECPRIDVRFRDWKAAGITKNYAIYSSNTFCVTKLVRLICLT